MAATDRGICKLAFFDSHDEQDRLIGELNDDWHAARIQRDETKTHPLLRAAFPTEPSQRAPLHLQLRGSRFQLQVWEALLAVPAGQLIAYEQVAALAKSPTVTRAVASAIARNQIAYLIPCHRVIRKTGEFGQYRWGSARKLAMTGWEASGGARFSAMSPDE